MFKKTFLIFLSFIIIFVLVSSIVAAKSETKYIYSIDGRLVECTDLNGTLEFQYDKNGNLMNKARSNNLLSNSGFEANLNSEDVADGWNKYIGQDISGSYETITSSVAEGQKAQKISATTLPNVGDGMNVWQEFFIKGSLSYSVKGMLKLANMKNAKLSVIVFFYDANNQMVGGQTPVEYTQNTADWVAFSGNFTSPANATSARIHFHLHGTSSNAQGTVSVDGTSVTLQEDTNLLFNAGFESNKRNDGTADGWNKYMGQGTNGNYETLTSSVAEGRKAQKIGATTLPNVGDGMNVWQEFFIKESLSYNVKGMLKLANMKNAKFSVIVYFYDANNQMVGGQTPIEYTLNTADWVTFSGNFTSPANATSARIHFHLHGTSSNAQGTVSVDGTSVTLQEDTNLLFNAGFESNKRNDSTADGWNKYMGEGIINGSYEIITSSVAEGKKAQKMSATALPNADGMNVWQEFFIKGSLSYNVKGMLKLANMKNAKLSVIVFFYDANNQMVGGQTPVEYTENTADWVAFSGNFTSPANATSARIHFHLHGTASNAQGIVNVDGLSVKKI